MPRCFLDLMSRSESTMDVSPYPKTHSLKSATMKLSKQGRDRVCTCLTFNQKILQKFASHVMMKKQRLMQRSAIFPAFLLTGDSCPSGQPPSHTSYPPWPLPQGPESMERRNGQCILGQAYLNPRAYGIGHVQTLTDKGAVATVPKASQVLSSSEPSELFFSRWRVPPVLRLLEDSTLEETGLSTVPSTWKAVN